MFCLVHSAGSCMWHSFFQQYPSSESFRLIIFHSRKSVQSPLIEIKCGFGRLRRRVNVTAVENIQSHLFSNSAAADGTPLPTTQSPPITLTSPSMSSTPRLLSALVCRMDRHLTASDKCSWICCCPSRC